MHSIEPQVQCVVCGVFRAKENMSLLPNEKWICGEEHVISHLSRKMEPLEINSIEERLSRIEALLMDDGK